MCSFWTRIYTNHFLMGVTIECCHRNISHGSHHWSPIHKLLIIYSHAIVIITSLHNFTQNSLYLSNLCDHVMSNDLVREDGHHVMLTLCSHDSLFIECIFSQSTLKVHNSFVLLVSFSFGGYIMWCSKRAKIK